ncbi:MAG: Mth938-like domain-containing protein [Pseudomonadota bacterium]|jgi:uncharacterized protein
MKLHLSDTAGLNAITGHGPGHVLVNGQRHESPLLLEPTRPPEPMPDLVLAGLRAELFDAIARRDEVPEIVLLGTGARLRFPPMALLRPLSGAAIGYEVMDTAAACRTYNILMGEGRRVLALLLFDA